MKVLIPAFVLVFALACGGAEPGGGAADLEAPQLSTNAPPPGFATRWDYVKSFSTGKDILDAYHAGLINKDESMMAMDRLGNKAAMDIYGKVVDQDEQPVAGVKVQGLLKIGIGYSTEQDTETDAQGQFHFLRLHGQGLGIRLQKEGYQFGYKIPYQRPVDYVPDPKNPVIINLWKLQGAEPMKHISIQSSVPCDGTVKRFDLLTNKMNGTIADIFTNNGDLTVSLTRNPLNIDSRNRYKPFNWSVTLAITNGGLEEITNRYPYEAPAEGYQSTITLDFPTNMVGWQYEVQRGYYFKSKAGQVYGRMTLDIDASRPSPPTYISAEIYANPGGSRNLEFDPRKQITR